MFALTIKKGKVLECMWYTCSFFVLKFTYLAVIFYSKSRLINNFLGILHLLFGFMFAKIMVNKKNLNKVTYSISINNRSLYSSIS